MRIWRFYRQLASAFLIACIGIHLLPSALLAEESVQEIESRRDYFRITGEVQFEGERIVYDDIIEFRVDVGVISTMGLKKGDNRIIMSRRWITRALKVGGALIMEVPNARGLFADLEQAGQPADPRWTPSYIKHYLRPPEEFLPEFLWMDSVTAATTIEVYIAEAYYAQPSPRLIVTKPIRIEYEPPAAEAAALAPYQARGAPRLDFGVNSKTGWQGLIGYSMTFQQIRQLAPAIASEIDNSRSQNITVLSKASTQELFDLSRRDLKFSWGYRTKGYGVPQPKKYPDGHGLLFRKWSGLTGDEAIHVVCNIAQRACELQEDKRGYVSFYEAEFRKGTWTLQFDGYVHQMEIGRAIIDHQKQRVVLIGGTRF